jgi:L-amino acid N-acyltransferase YncA
MIASSPLAIVVRDARLDDLAAIVRIYNEVIETSVATFDLEPFTLEERRSWFEKFGAEHPLIVAEVAGQVAGFAYYLPYRDKPGYSRTKETTIYIDRQSRAAGVGSALYTELIERARRAGVHVLIAGLGGENKPSEALHRKFGFEFAGRMREVGFKFGEWIDVYFYQKTL